MGLTLITEPTVEPVTLAEAKTHLRITGTDHDTLITALIVAARQYLEDVKTGRAFITQTWDLTMDSFPACILVPFPPLQSVTSLKYYDTDGTEQTWDASNYRVDIASEPGRITPAYGVVWPSVRRQTGTITVRFVAGYGLAAAVPENVKHLVKLLIGTWFEYPEGIGPANIRPLPFAVEALSSSLRVYL